MIHFYFLTVVKERTGTIGLSCYSSLPILDWSLATHLHKYFAIYSTHPAILLFPPSPIKMCTLQQWLQGAYVGESALLFKTQTHICYLQAKEK